MLLRGVIAVILGIVLLIWPHPTLGIFRVLFVAYALVDGTVAAVTAIRNATAKEPWIRRALEAAIAIAAAIVVWVWPHIALAVLGYLIGAALVLRGIVQIVGVLKIPATEPIRSWLMVGGIVSLIAGTVFLFSPRAGLNLFVWMLAAYGLLFGVILIAVAFGLKRDATG